MIKLLNKSAFLAVSIACAAMPAQAAVVVLDFEGVGDLASVDEFYNGGTDSLGNSGTNYGISFSDTSLGIVDVDAGGTGNFANEPSADTVLFFLSGGAATMNYAAGFDTGFSFFYSANGAGFVNVYDGLNGTGNLLATLDLASQFDVGCDGDPTGQYCNWDAVGVTFDGVARSVDFGGSANFIGFDDVTFGAATPGVPEASTWAMMLLGLGFAGAALRMRPITRVGVGYSS